MKKIFTVLTILVMNLFLPVKAEYWAKLSNTQYIDLDSISYEYKDDGYIACMWWSRFNVAQKDAKTEKGEKIFWVEYIDRAVNDFPYFYTLMEISYDANFKRLDSKILPFGQEAHPIPKNTVLDHFYNFVFLGEKEIDAQKQLLEAGVIEYIIPKGVGYYMHFLIKTEIQWK